MDELLRPVAVAQRFLADRQDIRNKEIFQAVADRFDSQFGTAAGAQQVIIQQLFLEVCALHSTHQKPPILVGKALFMHAQCS